MFDQGLNPLTDVPIAGLRPDILTLEQTIYVEAKQYTGASARSRALLAIREAADGWGRVRNAVPGVDEAFVIVFRRGGPRLEFETEELFLGGRRMYLVLADIAETAASGSRQSAQPIVVKKDAMLEVISKM